MSEPLGKEQRIAAIGREHWHAMATLPDPVDSWLNGYRDDVGYLLASLAAAEAELETLREALREIEKFPSTPFSSQVSLKALRRIQAIAAAALSSDGREAGKE